MANERKTEELTWQDVLLGTMLLPFLLSGEFLEEYKKELEAIEENEKKNEKDNTRVDKVFGDVDKKKDENDFSVSKVVNECAKKEQELAEQKAKEEAEKAAEQQKEEEVKEPADALIVEFGGVDPDEFSDNIVKNNKHEDYYSLSAFVRDALVDLETGTEELGWVYDPNETRAELKLNEHVEVTNKTATLLNSALFDVDLPVHIERRGDEHILVVEL